MGKNFLSAFFCTIVFAMIGVNSFTETVSDEVKIMDRDMTNITTADIDAVLLERGYPKIVIDTMDSGAKEDLYYNPDLTFSSAYIMFPGESQFIAGDGILPVIENPISDVIISWVNSAKKENSGSKKEKLCYIDVKFSYHWTKIPFSRWQDPIIISWDKNRFYMMDDSFYKVDKYDGYIATVTGIKKTFKNQITSLEPGYANGSPFGVKWYADLKGYDGITRITSLHGYGSFQLIPIEKDTDVQEDSPIYAQYIHKTTIKYYLS